MDLAISYLCNKNKNPFDKRETPTSTINNNNYIDIRYKSSRFLRFRLTSSYNGLYQFKEPDNL